MSDFKIYIPLESQERQDQGVAVDLRCPGYDDFQHWTETPAADRPFRLLALDRVTNPQNLGMIVRSVCASPLTALLLPAKGCAPLSPLVIKASAGTLLRCPILRCGELAQALTALARRRHLRAGRSGWRSALALPAARRHRLCAWQ